MSFKVVFKQQQIVGDRTGGWSTTFWNSGGSMDSIIKPQATISSEGFARDLAKALDDCLGNQTVIKSARASEDGMFRATRKQPFAFGSGSITDNDSDYCTNSLALLLKASNGQQTRVWLRGIMDACVTRGAYTPTPTFIRAFERLKFVLTSRTFGWSIRVSNKANVYYPVTGITEAGVVEALNHPFVPGDVVRLSLVVNPKSINGLYRVTEKTTNTVTIKPFAPPTPFVLELSKTTRMRKLSPDYRDIVSVEVERATSHRVGRPSDLLGGSRKKR